MHTGKYLFIRQYYRLESIKLSKMYFQALILIESLVYALLVGIAIFLTKFVNLFEVHLEFALMIGFCFFKIVCGALIFLLLLRFAKRVNAKNVKSLVGILLITLVILRIR